MRAPLGWLRDYAALAEDLDGRSLAEALIRAGLEVETVEQAGADVTGPLVVGRVLVLRRRAAEERQGRSAGAGSTSAGAQRPAGSDERGPSAGLAGHRLRRAQLRRRRPGGRRRCPVRCCRRLRDRGAQDVRARLRRDDLLRQRARAGRRPRRDHGAAGRPEGPTTRSPATTRHRCCTCARRCWTSPSPRTAATACRCVGWPARRRRRPGVAFRDPVDRVTPPGHRTAATRCGRSPTPARCSSAVSVDGVDPSRPSPRWLARRVQLAGMRSISLAVDITNYVMLETGQPIHAYDADRSGRADRGPAGDRRGEADHPRRHASATLQPRRPGHHRRLRARSGWPG